MATTGRDSGRSSVKELFSTKAKCVVNPDFTLDHYNISGSMANYDLVPTGIDGLIPDEYSLSFDGVDDSIEIENDELDYNPDSDARSWSIWFKRDDTNFRHPYETAGNYYDETIFEHGHKDGTIGTEGFNVVITDTAIGEAGSSYGNLKWGHGNGALYTADDTTNYADDEWHHIVVVNYGDGDTADFYIDGAKGNGTNNAGANPNVNIGGKLYLGQTSTNSPHSAYSWFGGSLTSFSYWTKALSSVEVTELYNQAKLFDIKTHSAGSYVKLWWKLGYDESDSSGNGYALTINSAPASQSDAPQWSNSPKTRQLPFSKRFQVIRALDGSQITKG